MIDRCAEIPNLKEFGWGKGAGASTRLVEFLNHDVSSRLERLQFSLYWDADDALIEALIQRDASRQLKRVKLTLDHARAQKLVNADNLSNVEVWDIRLPGETYGHDTVAWESPAAQRWDGILQRAKHPDIIPELLRHEVVKFERHTPWDGVIKSLTDPGGALIRAPKVEQLMFQNFEPDFLNTLIEQGPWAYPMLQGLHISHPVLEAHHVRTLGTSTLGSTLTSFTICSCIFMHLDELGHTIVTDDEDDLESFERKLRPWIECAMDTSLPRIYRLVAWQCFIKSSPDQVKHHRIRARLIGLPKKLWTRTPHAQLKANIERAMQEDMDGTLDSPT